MRRVSLSQKVFLLFASLTAMTFFVAVTVYLGFESLHKNNQNMGLVQDFRIQIKTLEAFDPRNGARGANLRDAEFEGEIETALQLARRIERLHDGITEELARRLNTVVAGLGYYRDAYRELREKYALDGDFSVVENQYFLAFEDRKEELSPGARHGVHDYLEILTLLRWYAYHTRDMAKIGEMHEIRQGLSKLTTDPQVLEKADRLIAKTEDNYINFLAIKDREGFLQSTADRFFEISADTMAALSRADRATRARLTWMVNGLVVLSVILTLLFWFLATRYFKRFLQSQQHAIEAIQKKDYDYEPSAVSNDEIGDLALFMKELAVTLKANEAFFADTLDHLPSFLFVLTPEGTVVFANKTALQSAGLTLGKIRGKRFYDAFWVNHSPAQRQAMKEWIARAGVGETIQCEMKWRTADASLVWVEFRLSPIFDQQARVKYLIPEASDISSRKRAETELRLAATAFETHDAILVADRLLRVLRVNQAFTDITGYSAEEAVGMHPRFLKSDRHDKAFFRELWGQLQETGCWRGEIWNRRKNGEVFPAWMSITEVKDTRGEITHFIGNFVDLSESKRQQDIIEKKAVAEQALGELLRLSLESHGLEEYFRRVLNVLFDSVPWLQILPKGGIFLSDEKEPGGVLRLSVSQGMDPELSKLCDRLPFGKCFCGKAAATRRMQYSSSTDDEGHEIHYEGMPPHGHYNLPILLDEEVLGVIVLYLPPGSPQSEHDLDFLYRVADVLSMGITRRRAEAEMQHRAAHDSLTDLPNRHLLQEHLKKALALARRHRHLGAVLFIDLDNFKTINDSLGHPIGDDLLKEVARRLTKDLRQEDTVARLGGDEFVLLLSEVGDDKDTAARRVRAIAEKLSDSMSLPYAIQGHELQITPSIGIALFPIDGEDSDDILKNADTAMYRAKEAGRNTIRYFLPSMQLAAENRLRMQSDLRNALRRNELFLQFQPQVDASGVVIGAEALVRWQHPERGIVMPKNFIHLSEETGQILAVGEYVLRSAANQLQAWGERFAECGIQSLSVNVSPLQFSQTDFALWVERILAETGADPRYLKLELTEGVLLENVEGAARKMGDLSKLGVRFSIDDFGTGYSSLAYLKRLPLDEIKIDRSFIRDIASDPSDANLVETMIAMAANLGIDIVAEGVEKEEQLNFLRENNCRYFQGYYFNRPVPANEFLALIDRQRKPRNRPAQSGQGG